MNRRVLIQVTTPAVAIGLLLLGTCLVSAWYIHRLQANLAHILSLNVTSLEAAQELEIRVRQLRSHSFLFLINPTPERHRRIEEDHEGFATSLRLAKHSANTPQKQALVREIEAGYQRYQGELGQLKQEVKRDGPLTEFGKLMDAHPIRHVIDPCHELLTLNKTRMEETAEESDRVSKQAHLAMLVLGIVGPLGGLIMGYGMAQGLSRSITRLSIRVQDMAQRLDQDVGSVSVAADGDIEDLDQQMQHVVLRVEEVAERLQQHQRELIRAEQLSAVGQLAASVAHEVRNPLTSIKMLVEAALRARNRKPLTVDDLKVIHTEVTRLERTVQGYLDFARLPASQRNVCDLREIVEQAIELVRARARLQRVDLSVELPSEPARAKVDRGQLCTVLVNLLINALDSMPQGGQLRTDLVICSGTGIRIEVADTGAGISTEMVGRLFTPFASSKPTGTGLGLSISQRILVEHGGHITGANRPQGGASFTITLPALAPEEAYADAVGH
jgi:signal transduction histidine kinase